MLAPTPGWLAIYTETKCDIWSPACNLEYKRMQRSDNTFSRGSQFSTFYPILNVKNWIRWKFVNTIWGKILEKRIFCGPNVWKILYF